MLFFMRHSTCTSSSFDVKDEMCPHKVSRDLPSGSRILVVLLYTDIFDVIILNLDYMTHFPSSKITF